MKHLFKARGIFVSAIIFLIVISIFIESTGFPYVNKDVESSSSSIYEMDIQNDWTKIKASLGIVEGIKLKNCDADFSIDGRIYILKFQLVDKGQMLYDVIYNPHKKKYSIYSRESSSGDYTSELIDAESFFKIFSSLNFQDIVSLGEYERCHISASGEKSLHTDEDICTFEIKDKRMVGIDVPDTSSYGYQFRVTGIEEMPDAPPIEFNKISLLYNIVE